ncbi:MAG TPA: ATP-grasp domain-containing protein [Polyangiaceae bacterium]|nr:ATP-grasp domain-containing protein [Polyangiaceae bacterium]
MARALLCVPATSYRPGAWVAAAEATGVELVLATDLPAAVRRYELPTVAVDFADVAASLAELASYELDAVAAVDERSAALAATVARQRGLPFHSVEGVEAARDKRLMRTRLLEAGVPVPAFRRHAPGDRLDAPTYPCVVKPPMLSGSQGVIRADDPDELTAAVDRVRRILARHPSPLRALEGFDELLVEAFVPGPEVAVEAVMTGGKLELIALFDKPDPLDGPYFEETLYVTPSRHPDPMQERIIRAAEHAARALGLGDGPIHAELRLGAEGPVILEVAARSIGGLCAQALHHVLGGERGPASLEALLLARSLRLPVDRPSPRAASGVMMLPVPRDGVLRAIHGLEAACAVPHVHAITVTVERGQAVRGLPEGNSYLGFAFAHAPLVADDPAGLVEEALRRAHGLLRFELAPLLQRY